VIKFLSSLLSLLDRLWAAWDQSKWQQQGRQQAQKEAADEVQRQLDLAEAAARLDDLERNKRLRNRFDDATGD
jgi:cytochrome c biogenesis protein ResB